MYSGVHDLLRTASSTTRSAALGELQITIWPRLYSASNNHSEEEEAGDDAQLLDTAFDRIRPVHQQVNNAEPNS